MLQSAEDFPRTKGKKLHARRRDGKFDVDIFYALYEKGFHERGPLLLNLFDPACDDERKGSGWEQPWVFYGHNNEWEKIRRNKNKLSRDVQDKIECLARQYNCSFEQMANFISPSVRFRPLKTKG